MKATETQTNPWDHEPDALDFVDDATGLPCAMRRGPGGHWCGYIGIPAEHPWHGKDYDYRQPMPDGWLERAEGTCDEIGVLNIFCSSGDDLAASAPLTLLVRCHGGLTYANKGEFIENPAADWWLGFDCAHSGDFTPKWGRSGTYRDVEFVKAALAKAAKDIARFMPASESPC